ncbi:MarR family transcriptional regulator [Microbispora sp. NPDC088329]|uniref:MarR family winged helix-turn-helix transcriptional regulator n=1 Tax=Microbispora sp. NPDC088329 TaxID=3154869 RepID=UPI00342ECB84
MEGEGERWAPERYAAFWINHSSRKVTRLHELRLRPIGLSMANAAVLLTLAEDGPLSQKDLTRLARVEQPTMAEMLSRMERDGLVCRQRNPRDRRGSLFSLTDLARDRLDLVREALLQGERDALSGLTDEETEQLIRLLRRVAGNVDQAAAPLQPPR